MLRRTTHTRTCSRGLPAGALYQATPSRTISHSSTHRPARGGAWTRAVTSTV